MMAIGPLPEPTRNILSREALGRVLGSLLEHELANVRGGRRASGSLAEARAVFWQDNLRLSADGPGEPGCDSLERLQLGAAVNELFHLHEAGDESNLLQDDRFGSWIETVNAAWRRGVRRVTFMTSGSTGRPKRCTHTLDHLAVEVSFLAARFRERRRIVAMTPAHHIYGFIFTGLLADRLGVPVWSAEQVGAGDLASALEPGDLIVAVPARWSWIERSLPSLPAGIVGISSTSPCSGDLIHALRAKGLDAMVEVYGSSETAGIALREAPTEPYVLMPHWSLEQAADGDAAAILTHRSGWKTPLPDQVVAAGPDAFVVQGRHDGSVQVGGTNVYPAQVARRLCECSGVQQANVRLMRSDEGTRLKAFVVPIPGFDIENLESRLIAWSNKALSTAERPKSFSFGSVLPTTPFGKAADW